MSATRSPADKIRFPENSQGGKDDGESKVSGPPQSPGYPASMDANAPTARMAWDIQNEEVLPDPEPETFILPFAGQHLIYRPRRRLAFSGNRALVECLRQRHTAPDANPASEVERFLRAVGYDDGVLGCEVTTVEAPVRPAHAVLLMTNQCNLRCTYCYANAGEEGRIVRMPWEIARIVIDAAVANAAATDGQAPTITFHGGGEPTVHWDIMTRAIEYARSLDARTRFSMSTNGVWTAAQREFICAHFDNISLSLDGIRDVQDRQRPRIDGSGSFDAIMENVRAMEDAGIEYGVRMTVLPETVSTMTDSVRFLCESTRTMAIQIEPTFTSSRGHYADLDDAFADAFAEAFIEAWEVGRGAGRQVYYSGARPWVISPVFCLAPLQAMVATADGRLVTCFEVFSEQSPLAGAFTVGRIENGQVCYDIPALRDYLDRQQQRRADCRDCFCYWHCSGDCATRRPGPATRDHGRCRTSRRITLRLLLDLMEEGGGMWHGLMPNGHGMGCSCENEGTSLPSDGHGEGLTAVHGG
jgi:uncharacterized protein